jgi:chondroitin polymerizing factor/chondroitin polymerizing factor 2
VYLLTDDSAFAVKELEMVKAVNEHLKDLVKKYASLLKASTTQIHEYRAKLTNTSMYFSDSYRQLVVAEHIAQNLSADSLVLLAPPCVELQSEFLNRVRLNTIKNTQIFFPIPFYEYMPNIVYPSVPYPPQVDIHKTVGYYSRYSYSFVAYYNADFVSARARFLGSSGVSLADAFADDLYGLFAAHASELYVLRATDQALKCRWHLIGECDDERQMRSDDERWRCLKQKENSLGTKAQLAMHLMKNYDSIVQA